MMLVECNCKNPMMHDSNCPMRGVDEWSKGYFVGKEDGRYAALKEAFRCADEWRKTGDILLKAGEMTKQELRTAKAVADGIARAIRALQAPEPRLDVTGYRDRA